MVTASNYDCILCSRLAVWVLTVGAGAVTHKFVWMGLCIWHIVSVISELLMEFFRSSEPIYFNIFVPVHLGVAHKPSATADGDKVSRWNM